MINRETLVVRRPAAAQVPSLQRGIADHLQTPVDHNGGFPQWLVLIPVMSLVAAGLSIVVLAAFVEAPRPVPSPSPSIADEELQVNVPVVNEIEVGATTVRFGTAYTR